MSNSPITLSHWHTEPALIGGTLFVCWAYFVLVGPLHSAQNPDSPFRKSHACWFGAGILSFYLAVGSPLDPLGENYLFFAHMIQHNILMYVSPLFILLGIPHQNFDEFLERNPITRKILRFLLHPIIAGLLFTMVFSFWHIGVFYEAAIRDKTLHMAEHLSMFFTSILMWWPLCSKSKYIPALSFGPQMLYVLALMLGQTPIFAILTFSKDVLYDTYFYAERIMNISPLEDQKTGGVLMKLANMIVSVSVLSSIFYRWSKKQEV
jgi:putative membrane protein